MNEPWTVPSAHFLQNSSAIVLTRLSPAPCQPLLTLSFAGKPALFSVPAVCASRLAASERDTEAETTRGKTEGKREREREREREKEKEKEKKRKR